MKKLINSFIFLPYLFLIFFIIINVYIVFQININDLLTSYITIYTFWFLIIILLIFISTQINFEDNNHV